MSVVKTFEELDGMPRRPGIGSYPLSLYFREPSRMGFVIEDDEKIKLRGWRWLWHARKPWKTVRPAWLAYVCEMNDIDLQYTGKASFKASWKCHMADDYDIEPQAILDVYMTYFLSTGSHFDRMRAFDTAITLRKHFKMLSSGYIRNAVRELGGEVE